MNKQQQNHRIRTEDYVYNISKQQQQKNNKKKKQHKKTAYKQNKKQRTKTYTTQMQTFLYI